jgi:hypothetical protein
VVARKIRVCVKRDDIKRGKRGLESQCPIARALRRRLGPGGGHGISVGCGSVEFVAGKTQWSAGTPYAAAKFIMRFDNATIPREEIKPKCFTFEFVKH